MRPLTTRYNFHRLRHILVAISIACFFGACATEKSRNPLSPSIAGPIEGVAISSPISLQPADGQLIRSTDQPIHLTFDQVESNSERPFWYELQVSAEAAFTNIIYLAEKIPPSGGLTEQYALNTALDNDHHYYWRVRALDGANTGPYSIPASFEIFTPLVVGTPIAISPLNGTVAGINQPDLTIENASIIGTPLSTTYRFELSTDHSFSNIVHSATASSGSTTTTVQTGPLAWNTQYHWRSQAIVNGKEGVVEGTWSDAQTFQTASQPVTLGTPTPISPINSTLVSSTTPTFTVVNGTVDGPSAAITIFFQVGTDPDVNTVIASFEQSASPTGTTAVTSPTLPSDTILYWRVTARNGTEASNWSTSYDFRTPTVTSPETTPPSQPGCCPPPNRFSIVQEIAEETGYPDSGIHVSDFTQKVAERLHAEDPNWGRRINITGPIGKDTVAYKVNGSTDNPFSVDIVLGAGGSNPQIHWDGHGQIGGTWITP